MIQARSSNNNSGLRIHPRTRFLNDLHQESGRSDAPTAGRPSAARR